MSHEYPCEEHSISDLVVFLIAGHETTAHTMSFFLYCLAKYPETQLKLQKELDEVHPTGPAFTTESRSQSRSLFCLSDVANLEYFSYCLKESQRLYPVAPIISRNVSVDLHHNGMVIPKGSIVGVAIGSMSRQPWINRPDDFIPERWEETAAQVSALKEMFMPFSIGKRSCIGQNLALMELKVIVANIVKNFSISLVEEPEFDHFITFKPKTSLLLKFSSR